MASDRPGAMAEPRDITGDTTAEWLETDGLGGFACGTVSGVRTRRYHALLVAATKPPLGRMTLVNGVEVWISTPAGRYALTSHRYLPDVIHPDGARHLTAFTAEPWPRWQYTLPDGTGIEQELFVPHGHSACVLAWRATPGRGVTLEMRPLLSGRDYHATHHENSGFRFDPRQRATRVIWTPFDGVPGVEVYSNGDYEHSPDWYRSFSYSEELARGLDHVEDLASPGIFRWRLAAGDAVCLFATQGQRLPDGTPADAIVASLRAHEQRRRSSFPSPLHRAADAFIVSRGQRTDDRRRLPLVHGLGPRHVHRHARPLPRDRTARRRRGHPRGMGGNALRGNGCRTASATAAELGLQLRRRVAVVCRGGGRIPPRPAPAPAETRQRAPADSAAGRRRHPHRLRRRHALRHPRRCRRAARLRRARRAADLDGRPGRRLGRHAAESASRWRCRRSG